MRRLNRSRLSARLIQNAGKDGLGAGISEMVPLLRKRAVDALLVGIDNYGKPKQGELL